MKTVILFLLILSSMNLYAKDNMKLIADLSEDRLNVYVVNELDEKKYFNKRFSIGPESGPNEISFLITNSEGVKQQFVVKVRLGSAVESDFMILSPGVLIGRSFEVSSIVNYYGLNEGRYSVQTVYHNKHGLDKGAFDESILSNVVSLLVKN